MTLIDGFHFATFSEHLLCARLWQGLIRAVGMDMRGGHRVAEGRPEGAGGARVPQAPEEVAMAAAAARSYGVKPPDPRPPPSHAKATPDPQSPTARASETLKRGPSGGSPPHRMMLSGHGALAHPALRCPPLRLQTRGPAPPWGAALHRPASSRGAGSLSAPNHALPRGRAGSGFTSPSQNQAKRATTGRPEATTPGRGRPRQRPPGAAGPGAQVVAASRMNCSIQSTSRQARGDGRGASRGQGFRGGR